MYAHPGSGFVLDIGCAMGAWAYGYARAHPELNLLGLEIRKPVAASATGTLAPLPNAAAAWGNVAPEYVSPFLSSLPGPLLGVAIQFPDPWFKKRHHKRRVLTPALLDAFVAHFADNASSSNAPTKTVAFYIQTDVESLFDDMNAVFVSHPSFVPGQSFPGHDPVLLESDILESGLSVKTELESKTIARSLPVHRALYHLPI